MMQETDGAPALLPSTFFPCIQFIALSDKYKGELLNSKLHVVKCYFFYSSSFDLLFMFIIAAGAVVQDISSLGCISAERAVLLSDSVHGAITLKSAASLQSETALFNVDVACKLVLRSWNIKTPASIQGFVESCFAAHVVVVCAVRFNSGDITHGMMYPFLGGHAIIHVGPKLPSPALQAAFEDRRREGVVALVTPLGPNSAGIASAQGSTLSGDTPPRSLSVPGRLSSSSSSSTSNQRLSPCLPLSGSSGERRLTPPVSVSTASGSKGEALLNRASSFGRYNRIQKLVSSSSPRGIGATSPSSDCSDAPGTSSQKLLRLIRSNSKSPMNLTDEDTDVMLQERDLLNDELSQNQYGKRGANSDAFHFNATPPVLERVVEAGVFVTPGSPALLGNQRSRQTSDTELVDTPSEVDPTSASHTDASRYINIGDQSPSAEATMQVAPDESPATLVTSTPQTNRRVGTPGSRDIDRNGEGTMLFYSPASFTEENPLPMEEEGDGSRSLLGDFKEESRAAASISASAPFASDKAESSSSGSASLFSEVMQRVTRGLPTSVPVIEVRPAPQTNAVTPSSEPTGTVQSTLASTAIVDDPGASLHSHDVPSITSASDKSDSHLGDDESKVKFLKILRSLLKTQPALLALEKDKAIKLKKILENGFIYLVTKPSDSSRLLLKFIKDICKVSKGKLFYTKSQDIVLNICKLLSRLDLKYSDLVNSVTGMRSVEFYQSLLALQLLQVYFLLDLLSSYEKINCSNDFEKQVTGHIYKAFDNFRFWSDEDHCNVAKEKALLAWCLPSEVTDSDALMNQHTVEVVTAEGVDEDRVDLLGLLSVVFNRQYSKIPDVISHMTEQVAQDEISQHLDEAKIKVPDTSLVDQFAGFLKPRKQSVPTDAVSGASSASRSLFRSKSLNSIGMDTFSPVPDSRLSMASGGFDDIMISSSDMFGAFDIPMPEPESVVEIPGPARANQGPAVVTPGSAQKVSASPSSTNPLLAGSNRSKINGHRTNMDQRLTRTVSTAPAPLRPSVASGQAIIAQRSSAAPPLAPPAAGLRPPIVHPIPPRPRGSKITDYTHPTSQSSQPPKQSFDALYTPTSDDKRNPKRSRSFVVEDTPISKLRR